MNDLHPRPRLLLVEDDEFVREMLELVLTDHGYKVFAATNGDEAISILKAQKVEACLCDIIMPDSDGLEFILQAKKICADVPIIAMSGGGRIGPESYLATAQRLGATQVLRKPIDSQVLLEELRKLTEGM